MTTWANFRARLRGIVQDESPPYAVQNDQMLYYTNYGISWCSTRHPIMKHAELPVVAGIVTLPEDLIHIISVMSNDQQVKITDLVMDGANPSRGQCVRISKSQLRLGGSPASVELYYDGMHQVLDGTDLDELSVPIFLEEAVLYYAASRSLDERAAASASLDRWDMKIDSGKPTDNPFLQMANQYMRRAESVLHMYAQMV